MPNKRNNVQAPKHNSGIKSIKRGVREYTLHATKGWRSHAIQQRTAVPKRNMNPLEIFRELGI